MHNPLTSDLTQHLKKEKKNKSKPFSLHFTVLFTFLDILESKKMLMYFFLTIKYNMVSIFGEDTLNMVLLHCLYKPFNY